MTTRQTTTAADLSCSDDCGLCSRYDSCLLARLPRDAEKRCGAAIRRRFGLDCGGRLYRRGTPFDSLFQVCSGSIKTQRETPDGNLVVTGFYLPGDLVGIEAIADGHYPSDALATHNTVVCQLNFRHLMSECSHAPDLQHWLISRIAYHVRLRDNDLSWAVGLQTQQRVLRFFIDLSNRIGSDASTPRKAISLPMKKQDIARYLHITPETLSRSLAQLREEGLLELDRERYQLPDRDRALRATQI
ncbi:MAG: Crp/Fnr family transcriptional regulator [Chromatiaceae bacterium]|nr:Crp/Fnr family transcriptional regulator [Gammaproteobacteria bacterium]MCP5305961.1 Crp/Fnr family transcriptional regulator [Chromatiaceae bacterium]MCP5312821.1 Crp/Fnr family transcriptional regulator [Chromatiaceae bacterium]